MDRDDQRLDDAADVEINNDSDDDIVSEELIEEISIDGMCGVY